MLAVCHSITCLSNTCPSDSGTAHAFTPEKNKSASPLFRRFFKALTILMPYLLSHHPACSDFDNDVYRLGRWRFCIGCFTSYPLAVLTLITSILSGITNYFQWYILFSVGAALGLTHALSFAGLTKHKAVKVITKVFLGIGMGLCTYAVFQIPVHIGIRISIFYILFMAAMTLGSLRIIAVEKHCRACMYAADWFECPGFGKVSKKMIEEGFMHDPRVRG